MPVALHMISGRSETDSTLPLAFRQGLALARPSTHSVGQEGQEQGSVEGLPRLHVWDRDTLVQPTTTLSTSVTTLDAINPHELVQVVTATFFTGPTVAVAPPSRSAPAPVAAIAGGAAGGVVLAIIIVTAWKIWGRKIDKNETRKRKKLVSGN